MGKKLKDSRTEVREMTIETAHEELSRLRRDLFDLRMQSGRGEVKDVRQFAQTRKQVARIMHKLHMIDLEGDFEPEFIEAPVDDEPAEIAAPKARRSRATAVATVEPPVADDAATPQDQEEETAE